MMHDANLAAALPSSVSCNLEDSYLSKKSQQRKKAQLDALKKESERALVEQIRRLLALPMNKRTHFLRVRHPSGGSHLGPHLSYTSSDW